MKQNTAKIQFQDKKVKKQTTKQNKRMAISQIVNWTIFIVFITFVTRIITITTSTTITGIKKFSHAIVYTSIIKRGVGVYMIDNEQEAAITAIIIINQTQGNVIFQVIAFVLQLIICLFYVINLFLLL